jgi:flagellar hook-basal body complex protein FliE
VSELSLRPLAAEGRPGAGSPARGRSEPGFAALLEQALAEVNALQRRAEAAAADLATGRAQDTTAAVVALEQASIALQFTLAVRNRLLEAYQELMRLTV